MLISCLYHAYYHAYIIPIAVKAAANLKIDNKGLSCIVCCMNIDFAESKKMLLQVIPTLNKPLWFILRELKNDCAFVFWCGKKLGMTTQSHSNAT